MEHGAQSTQIQNYFFIWIIVHRRRHRPIEPRVFGQYYQLNEVTHLVEWVSFFEFGAGTFRFRSKTLKNGTLIAINSMFGRKRTFAASNQ